MESFLVNLSNKKGLTSIPVTCIHTNLYTQFLSHVMFRRCSPGQKRANVFCKLTLCCRCSILIFNNLFKEVNSCKILDHAIYFIIYMLYMSFFLQPKYIPHYRLEQPFQWLLLESKG